MGNKKLLITFSTQEPGTIFGKNRSKQTDCHKWLQISHLESHMDAEKTQVIKTVYSCYHTQMQQQFCLLFNNLSEKTLYSLNLTMKLVN